MPGHRVKAKGAASDTGMGTPHGRAPSSPRFLRHFLATRTRVWAIIGAKIPFKIYTLRPVAQTLTPPGHGQGAVISGSALVLHGHFDT